MCNKRIHHQQNKLLVPKKKYNSYIKNKKSDPESSAHAMKFPFSTLCTQHKLEVEKCQKTIRFILSVIQGWQ